MSGYDSDQSFLDLHQGVGGVKKDWKNIAEGLNAHCGCNKTIYGYIQNKRISQSVSWLV
tara:strand:+ start:241 stop:417 length:177 start_codon:yes stop_codon:yes gene_type:complete